MKQTVQCYLDNIEPFTTADWKEVISHIRKKCEWKDDELVCRYSESVSTCELKKDEPLSRFTPAADAWEGRFFNAYAEARWIRSPDGSFSVWITREGSSGRKVMREQRCYYLIGIWGKGQFAEHRYPGTPFDYGVSGKRDGDRAYIEVYEYAPAEPNWSDDPDEATIQARLNQPMIIAHRFFNVDAGRD